MISCCCPFPPSFSSAGSDAVELRRNIRLLAELCGRHAILEGVEFGVDSAGGSGRSACTVRV